MKVVLIKADTFYKLTVSYLVPSTVNQVWELLATDSGFARWFPQLKLDNNKLIFEMENFRETMDLLVYQPHEEIAFNWDTASVSFSLTRHEQGAQIFFVEEIPVNFGNEFADAKKDMTGWLVQNECIKNLLEGQDRPARQPLQEKWSAFLEKEL
ncbi:ATPase [Streptococcus suis]|uniref:ATPase n=1 Tax=Streptococcus suis TaxID=1307 RepID=UPI000CF6A8E2|nr:ATPase [Streptococcus suis]